MSPTEGALQCDILLASLGEGVEAELSTSQFSPITITTANGARNAAYSHSEAKRIKRELEDEYLGGGEVALFSDNLTFAELVTHCQQTKYCKAEYDDAGNKLFGVRDTTVYDAHLKHFRDFFRNDESQRYQGGKLTCLPKS